MASLCEMVPIAVLSGALIAFKKSVLWFVKTGLRRRANLTKSEIL